MKQIGRSRQRGSMLIVALAVLTLLSLIAVTFASIMRLERRATENVRNSRRALLLATSAESSVIALVRGGLFWHAFNKYDKYASPWIYGIYGDEKVQSYAGNRKPIADALPGESSYSWVVGGTYDGGSDYFKTKIIDAAAQINVNGEQDTLAQMLDSLGEALQKSTDYGGYNPFFEGPKQTGRKVLGDEIIRRRNRLEGKRFTSKNQVREWIGEVNFAVLEDFITTESWVDKSTFRGSDGVEQFDTEAATAPTTGVGAGETGLRTDVVGVARLAPEARAPINVNTAPKPVLIACLMGLGARRAFPYVNIDTQQTEERNRSEISADGQLPPTKEELTLRQLPVWVYSTPLRYEQALRIAEAIIDQRRRSPFTKWKSETGDLDGFYDFVNRTISDDYFPQPHEITVVNPRDKDRDNPRYRSDILNASNENGVLYLRGHDSREGQDRQSRGLPFSGRYAWYYDMMRGMLLANFNPNARINKYNPDWTAYQAVDKSNLIKLGADGKDATTPRPGHTTEFCFDSNGIFEITSFAQITGPTAVQPGVDEGPELSDYAGAERFSEVKQRTVVKVWEVLRHTTQQDFEQPFASGAFNSVNHRQYVSTFPDPMELLHRDIFLGSSLDGYVTIAGRIDAERQVLPAAQRSQFPYQSRNSYKMHEGFRFRDEVSQARLKRLVREGRTSLEYEEELRSVLNPDFAREGGNFEKRYSKFLWKSAKGEDEDEQILEPKVAPVELGGDIYPDGYGSSIFRHSPLGTPFVRYPASKYRTNPQDQGAMNARKNDIGNLPYYDGGVAFWIKFEFDGSDPVFCGLIGATQVQSDVGTDPDSSEGTQFYVWKNTSGELRISRLYYHQAFLKGQTTGAVPEISDEEDPQQGSPVQVDEQKHWARTDVVVPIKDWKAHEWHHIAVEFKDELPGNRVKVHLDFEDVAAVSHNLGENMYCALNVEEPKDEIYVGGFLRDQAAATEGLFKFQTNYDENLQAVAESIKRVPANATIDEFTTFVGTFNPLQIEGYFADRQATYTNSFSIPFPEGIQRLRLRTLTWTVYPPGLYMGRGVNWSPTRFACTVSGVGEASNQMQGVSDSGGDATKNANIAGRYVYVKGTLDTVRGAEIVYQFKMTAAQGGGGGPFGARFVAAPVLDDVTLTYYLPSAQILLTESE
ncbi:MAG: hypothetical protein L0Z55_04095 [Planctomycetes bacterium]|nr:hypothetical protein [Planctomycetota bacterium]